MFKIKLIEEFKEFRKVRNIINTSVLSLSDKWMVISYNKDFEKRLNEIITASLVTEILNGNVTSEWVNWFKSALTIRTGILSYTSKFNKN